MPPGAEPLRGEWKTAKNGKRYFTAFNKEAQQYGRASDAGKYLKGGGDQLANFKAAHVAMGLMQSATARSKVATLLNQYNGDVYYGGNDGGSQSGKDRLLEVVDFAANLAGASRAAEEGTEFHGLWEKRNAGEKPLIVQPHLEKLLDHYCARTAPIRFIDAECTIVNDEFQRAGSMDHLMVIPKGATGPDGEPLQEDWVCAGDGKGLPLDTSIPTPTGWTTMGELVVGDEVFGSDGRPCRVMFKSDVKRIGTHVVHFDDKSTVVCDTEHLWWGFTGWRSSEEIILPIADLIKRLEDPESILSRDGIRIPVAGALELPGADLPIDPYLLGAWIGDGNRGRGTITKEPALFEILAADGHSMGVEYFDKRNGVLSRTVLGLQTKLRSAGLLGDKHVPAAYLRADFDQRLKLVQGLMDTDGNWNIARNTAEFCSTSKSIALAMEELLLTLGQRPHLSERSATGYGTTVTAYVIAFTPVGIVPFRLPRKMERCVDGLKNKKVTRSTRRLITSVTPGPDVPTVCIAVDSLNRTYLCTERMIPTHNTGRWDARYPAGVTAQLATYALGQRYNQETNERTPLHPELNTDWAVMIHFPLAEKEPEVGFYWINLEVGRHAALLNNRLETMQKHFESVSGKPIQFELNASKKVS